MRADENQEDSISGDISCCCHFPSCKECKENLSRLPLHETDDHKPHPHNSKNQHRCSSFASLSRSVYLMAGFGITFLIASYAMFAFRPVDYIVENKLMLTDGSLVFGLWQKPPVIAYIKVYVFNVTNPAEFISGKEKLKLKQIGPYIYKEFLENTNATFNPNNTLTYIPRRRVAHEPSLPGSDPYKDYIYTPNVALLGLASMLHNSSTFLNLGVATLAKYLDSQGFVNISVHEMLWGYDEPLVKLAATFLPNWIPFYRLGLMDRMMDEGINVVTMDLNKPKNETKDRYGRREKMYNINYYNGKKTLAQWPGPPCNSLHGVGEGILHPRGMKPNDTFVIYRKAFCRTLQMEYSGKGFTEEGFPAFYFRFPANIFDSPDKNPDNACYCKPEVAPCLMSGLSDLSSCYYSIPLAMSKPHFYHGDPKLFERIEGLSPNATEHESIVVLQPDLGFPMAAHSRMQLNLAIHNTRLNPRTAIFNNFTVPIFWIDWYFDMPEIERNLFYIVLFVAPVIQTAVTVLFAILGAVLLAIVACSCSRKNTTVATKILSKSQHLLEKSAGEQLLGRRAQIVSR